MGMDKTLEGNNNKKGIESKSAYRFQMSDLSGSNNNNNSYSYILSFFLGQLNTDLTLQHPQAVTTVLTLLGSSRDLSPNLQHSIIKIIHDIFLQNDIVKAQMLENGLIDGLVELLVSNFQIRIARFAENEPPLEWETEEDILCFFKEIALFGCKNSTKEALLKEILLTINLYSTLPYNYVCSLQRRVLHDIFLFFNDNDFTAHEYLTASFDKICGLAISIVCYQAPSNFTNKTKLLRQSSQAVFPDKTSSKSDITASSDDTGTPRTISDDDQDSSRSRTRDNSSSNFREAEQSSGNTPRKQSEDFSNFNDSNTTTPVKSSLSLSKASVSITEATDIPQQTTTTQASTSSSPVPALNLAKASLVPAPTTTPDKQPVSSPATPISENSNRRPSVSPRYDVSPRSPAVIPTPTLMRANSDYYIVEEQQRGTLSQSAELYARQQEWVEEGHLYNEKEFIDLLFIIFTTRRRNAMAPSSHVEYFSAMSNAMSQRTYLSRLVIHFLQNPQYERFISHILSLLLSAGPDDVPIVVDFVGDEESIMRILFALRPMLHFMEEVTLMKVRKIFQVVFQAATQKVVPALKKMNLLKEDDKTEFNHVLETMLQPDVPTELAADFKKWNDKEETLRRDFQAVFRETFKTKQEIFSKTQAAIRFNKHLVNTTMASMHQQQFKPFHERMQLEMEEEREQQQQWRRLVKHVAHERGIWPAQDQQAVIKWELDPTEGPARMRIRLKSIDQHPSTPFVTATMSNVPFDTPETPDASSTDFISPEGLKAHYMHMQQEHTSIGDMKAYTGFNMINPRERIIFNLRTSRITPFSQQHGELLIGENNLYFIDERRMQGASSAVGKSRSGRARQTLMGNKPKQVMFPYEEIREIHKRRHLLKNNALEIFLLSGKTYLLAFEKMSDRDSVYDKIMSMDLPDLINYQTEMQGTILKMSITKKWQKGLISNFEYLMHLNTLAGRSFNDLTQYPVFPFIMKDRDEYDVENADNMRDLTKPMGAQDPVRLAKFIKKYTDLMDMPEEEGPYHYGSHYSNSGSVLHFLLRIEPFSGGFLDFQGGKFDVPDRSFHSIDQTWRLSSCVKQSSSDVKELIPEFFVLPEFLVNKNRFDFGKKQCGTRVDDVILPAWAKSDARYYIYKHRAALESKYVSLNLHHWIDLIFGCKQQGELAVKALNVFHPCTYEGAVDVDKIDDPLQRAAKISQISNFGQIPKQLFKDKHPAKNLQKLNQAIGDCVYTHPLQLTAFQIGVAGPIGSIVFINEPPVMLAPRKVMLYPDTSKYVSWGHWDQTLRICSMDTNKVITTIDIMHDDDILCGDMTKNGRLLVTGGTSCVVKVWRRPNKNNKEKADTLTLATTLCGHSDTILSLVVSQEWSIIVTGSADRSCIIWDLNRFSYVRSLSKHEGPVTVVAVSPSLGYIATSCVVPRGNHNGSILRLWSINGDELASVSSLEKITSAIFTGGMEGVVQNLLITGHDNGMIKLYNAWDLSLITTYYDSHRAPISALALSKDATQLFSGDTSGLSVCWSWKKPRDNYTLGIRI